MQLQHEKFASKYAKQRDAFERTIARLEADVAAGVVRNADFTDAKHLIGSTYSEEAGNARDLFPRVPRPEDGAATQGTLWQAQSDIYWLFPLEYRHLPSALKKLPKTLANNGFDADPAIEATAAIMRDFAERWAPVIDLVEKAKPLVVKGRAPIADEDRKTPLRTIENTGTCSCCSKNVKLEGDQQIYHHGFEVRWGQRNGSCAGVGYKPIELSPEGAVAYLATLRRERERLTKEIQDLASGITVELTAQTRKNGRETSVQITPEHERWKEVVAKTIRFKEGCVREVEDLIPFFVKRVNDWKPRPLPDSHLNPSVEDQPDPQAGRDEEDEGAPTMRF